MSNVIAEIIRDLLAEVNGSEGTPDVIELNGTTLSSTQVMVNGVSMDIVPEGLREMFLFRSHIGLNPMGPFLAGSIAVGIFPVRLDAQGQLVHASPSIKNAPWGCVSNRLPVGEWGGNAAIRPDIYVESNFYGFGAVSIPVPTFVKQPYKDDKTPRPSVSMQLSTANASDDQMAAKHNQARLDFQQLVQELAQELGVPAGEQFLVCMVGYPQYSKAFKGKAEQGKAARPFWGAAFDGAYMLGGCKIKSSKQSLPEGLNALKVNHNMMIGGRSLADRLAAEFTKAQTAPTSVPVTAVNMPAPAAPMSVSSPAPAPAVVPASVSAPAPKAAPAPVPAPAPKTNAMPSGGISALLGKMECEEADDAFQLLPVEPAAAPVEEEPQEEVQEAPPATIKRRANPFA